MKLFSPLIFESKFDHSLQRKSFVNSFFLRIKFLELWQLFNFFLMNRFQEADKYIDSHYLETGIATVFTYNNAVTLCIESHRYQPKNFW